MLKYFDFSPIVSYDILGNKNPVAAIDVTSRLIVKQLLLGQSVVYYRYDVADGDRPDLVSYQYYGSENYDWLILLVNEMHDPYYQWPMSAVNLDDYVRQKYGSVSVALQQVHHYEWIKSPKKIVKNSLGEDVVSEELRFVIDKTTYDSLSVSDTRSVDAYTYEVELNDDRRRIQLIDKSYLPVINKKLRELYSA